jgi:hypothetical protein
MSSALIAAPRPLTLGAPAAVCTAPGNFLADRLTVAQARALAADPATTIPMLASLAVREPVRVLANPAWELAMVAQPALLATVPDEALAAMASCAKADAVFLRSVAQSCVLRPAATKRTIWALASRADAAAEVLQLLASLADPQRTSADGREIARLRAWQDGARLLGWRAAVDVTGITFLQSRKWTDSPQPVRDPEAFSALLRDRPALVDSPIVRLIAMLGQREARMRILHAAAPTNATALEMLSIGDTIGKGVRVDDQSAWMMFHSQVGGHGLTNTSPQRAGPGSMGAAMGRGHQRQSARGLAHRWSMGERVDADGNNWGPKLHQGCMTIEDAVHAARDAPEYTCVHMLLLAHPRCPRRLLQRRVQSPNWISRLAVALNPAVGETFRGRLRSDLHWIVRAAAWGVNA